MTIIYIIRKIREKNYIILNNITKSNKIITYYIIEKSYIINNQFLDKENLKFKLVSKNLLKLKLKLLKKYISIIDIFSLVYYIVV